MKYVNVMGLTLGCSLIANGAMAYQSNGTVQDHYRTVIDRTPYQIEVCTDVSTSTKPKVGPLDLEGMIVGGIIGNQIGDMKGNGAAGALLGGLLGNQNTSSNVTSKQCTLETRYNESKRNAYSHSTITFAYKGKNYTVQFTK
tara:strand:+ start:384 stop:809 length:426 start_codon:yes stop_codon:yes gene_type:complete